MNTALVTGASSGIGLAIANKLLARNYCVLQLSYDAAELQQVISHPQARAVVCDLSQPQQVEGLWQRLESEYGPIRLLVNNAGVGCHKTVLETDQALLEYILQINFLAPASLCRQALAAMQNRTGGHICNLTSASGRRPLARMGAYGASKAALHGFTQALRLEAAALGVGVSEVLPISVRTPFFDRAGYRPQGLVQSPEYVADLVLKAYDQKLAEIVTHGPTRIGMALDALMPNSVARLLNWWERRQRSNRGR